MGGCFSASSKGDQRRTKAEEDYAHKECVSDSTDTEYMNNNLNEAQNDDADSEVSSVSSFHNKLPRNLNNDYKSSYWNPAENPWITKHGPQEEDSDSDVSSVSSDHLKKPQDFNTDYRKWYLNAEGQWINLKQ